MKRRSFLSGLLAILFAPNVALPKPQELQWTEIGEITDMSALTVAAEFEEWSPACHYEAGDVVKFVGDSFGTRADAFLAALPKSVQEANANLTANGWSGEIKPLPPAPVWKL